MVENLAERFVASRYRSLIVTGVTVLIALVTCLPQVDQLFADRLEKDALVSQLAHAEQLTARLPTYEKRLAEEEASLDSLRKRTVDEQRVADLRSWLVDAAREAGCQVRRIDLANPARRGWLEDDHPLDTPTKQEAMKKGATPFALETRTVGFSVTGSANEVFALLKAIDVDSRLMHTQTAELRPVNRSTNELQLDLSLWYFALVRQGASA